MKGSAKKAKKSKGSKVETPMKAKSESFDLKFTSEYDLNQAKVWSFLKPFLLYFKSFFQHFRLLCLLTLY